MLLASQRQTIARHAQRLRPDGLVVGVAGNISARAGAQVAITPRGLDYDELTPEIVAVVELEGGAVEGEFAPSTELPMHLAIYRRTGAQAIVHTHAPYATALSMVLDEIPPVHYLLAELGGPVRTAPYATPGSEQLAAYVERALEGRSAALLQSHGTIAIGETVERAYARTLILESIAAAYHRARMVGEPRLLSAAELDRVAEGLREYPMGEGAPA